MSTDHHQQAYHQYKYVHLSRAGRYISPPLQIREAPATEKEKESQRNNQPTTNGQARQTYSIRQVEPRSSQIDITFKKATH